MRDDLCGPRTLSGPLLGAVGLTLALLIASGACGADDEAAGECFDPVETAAIDPADAAPGTSITLLTHSSFALSDGVLDRFTDQTGVSVEVVAVGDAGTLVSESVLSRDEPLGDVMFGIDNTLLCRGLQADLFEPYQSTSADLLEPGLVVDPRVTPVDYGDVCLNYWNDALGDDPPASMEDLVDPAFAGTFVTENPETSSPGLAFLLATIDRFGEEGWRDYWARLRDNGLTVTSGWEEAYYGEFVAGGGDRGVVTSYATSPVAEVLFADPPVETPPTGVVTDGCFRQVEYAGILAGTDHPAEAAALIDFLVSEDVQADIPLSMFVFPARAGTDLPDLFLENAAIAVDPVEMDPADIERNRDKWLDQWTETVLG